MTSERQGIERRVSDLGLRALELIRIATRELGVSTQRSVEIAAHFSTNSDATYVTASGLEVRFSLESIDRRLRERLLDAIEATPRLRRGRPKRKG